MALVEDVYAQADRLTVEQAMEVAGVSRTTLTKYLRTGAIAATKHGKWAWSIPVLYDQDGNAHFLRKAKPDKKSGRNP